LEGLEPPRKVHDGRVGLPGLAAGAQELRQTHAAGELAAGRPKTRIHRQLECDRRRTAHPPFARSLFHPRVPTVPYIAPLQVVSFDQFQHPM